MRKTVVYLGSAMALALSSSFAQADGAAIYNSSCAACHAQGVAGAPKLGDAAAWKDRIAQGNDTLYEHAVMGYQGKAGYMPPKGGFANLSDDEVKEAVDYMVSNSK